jgi:hypothetical protein
MRIRIQHLGQCRIWNMEKSYREKGSKFIARTLLRNLIFSYPYSCYIGDLFISIYKKKMPKRIIFTSVADPDPGSGMGFFRIPDPKTII